MQLTEQHVIKCTDLRFAPIDAAAFAAKNLYNAANYMVRQRFIAAGVYLSYPMVCKALQQHEAYCTLPRKVSQQVLRVLDQNWQAFFGAIKAWRAEPGKFRGRPKLPGYLDKAKGRAVLTYTIQALSVVALREGVIAPSGLSITIRTKQTRIAQVRIVPRAGFYVVEAVYERDIVQADVDPALAAGVDIGLNNLAAITSNKPGFVPILVNGRPLKHLNQWYNKRMAELQSKLGHTGRTKQMQRITTQRNRQIHHYLHTHSKRVIDLLMGEGIGMLVIGKNDSWKQEINIGRRNNQQFVQIPHARFIQMLTYKAKLVGIQVVLVNESHTSKCSFLDEETVGHHEQYAGRRIKRGLFRAATGQLINADVNGAYNIIRKAIPNVFHDGKVGVVVHPVGIAPTH